MLSVDIPSKISDEKTIRNGCDATLAQINLIMLHLFHSILPNFYPYNDCKCRLMQT